MADPYRGTDEELIADFNYHKACVDYLRAGLEIPKKEKPKHG